MIVWASTYYAEREKVVRLEEIQQKYMELTAALERRAQEAKDETEFWKERSRNERERAERAVDMQLQTKFQHPGIQKDPEEVFERQQEKADDLFAEKPELVAAQHRHMEKHGPDSLLREELSGLFEPDDSLDVS